MAAFGFILTTVISAVIYVIVSNTLNQQPKQEESIISIRYDPESNTQGF